MRSVAGGAFMGIANLVPGVSGGTMLLAVGIYPQFIEGVAEVSTFKFRPRIVLMLCSIVIAAGLSIVGLATLVSGLLEHARWAMYALFIGLTLGGVPVLWRMIRPADSTIVFSSVVGIGLMAILALSSPERLANGGGSAALGYVLLFTAGMAGGAAMILPGLSGAYLLLVLGQYQPIIDAIAAAVEGARAGDWSQIVQTFHVLVPVGIGVAVGVVGVSNLVKLLLARFERATLGVLLGLLLGAVLGLWPFTQAIPPEVGDIVRGVELTSPAMVEKVAPKHWRHELILPSLAQSLAAVALAAVGFVISWGISRLGGSEKTPGSL